MVPLGASQTTLTRRFQTRQIRRVRLTSWPASWPYSWPGGEWPLGQTRVCLSVRCLSKCLWLSWRCLYKCLWLCLCKCLRDRASLISDHHVSLMTHSRCCAHCCPRRSVYAWQCWHWPVAGQRDESECNELVTGQSTGRLTFNPRNLILGNWGRSARFQQKKMSGYTTCIARY